MERNILIEGIDCAGKSTLCKELKSTLGWDTKFLGHIKGNQFDRYLKEYATLEHTILERGHISEAVYSVLLGRKEPFLNTEQSVLDNIIRKKYILIACVPPTTLAQKRHIEREHTIQQTPLQKLAEGNALFAKCFERFENTIPLIRYQSKDFQELEETIQTVKKLLTLHLRP